MIDKYFENIITKNKNKIFENNKIKYIIDKSIDNFNAYIYFIEKYQKIADINNNAIFEFAAYFSFTFEAFINDLVIYNTQSIMILQRVLLELYFKFMFIITSDKFVEDLFLDFKYINLYNLAKLEQTITKLSLDEQKSLNENYNKIIEKYNLNSCDQYGDDYWIKIAMEHLKVSNPSKSLNELIEYLIKNEYINSELKSDYKSCCDFIHSSQNAFGLTQCFNIDDNNYKYISGAINDFNFIIYSIIEQLNKKINLIFISYENKVKSNLNDIINFKD